MKLDDLSSISQNQLLALSMNNNLSESKNGSDDIQFALVMQALMENSNQSSDSEKLQAVQAIQNTETTPGQRLDYMKMVLNQNLSSYVSDSTSVSNNTSILNLASQTSDEKMKRIYSAVDSASKKYGVDSNLILGIIKQESDFNPSITSSAGAKGLMQLMPENCKSNGVDDPFNIEQNIEGGVKLLKGYMNQYNGNLEMALMAYNGGPGTMQRRGVTSSEHLYKMPKETQNYVPKVMSYYRNGI
ncbi:lytic transglycosylase domain-containing protein [Clostridium weizhouense]|uniref:Lytic transglycosylase domain-containing protein n=1 Tax=Clostridium weizhouense TaxID=2859781 RepID=A0ABS7ASA5_9CLOT|nr:lytic transglycosylase domain-containing protein [Clostridium weizhouense]MBW6410521.1 lytic transglycosylase domain-containing protein [Clostridium weizhouense]